MHRNSTYKLDGEIIICANGLGVVTLLFAINLRYAKPEDLTALHPDGDAGNAYLREQGIDNSTAWDIWQNVLALICICIITMTLAYVQLRRLKTTS